MHRLTEFVHYIVGNVRNVVYRALADRFEPVDQPCGRRADLYVSNQSSREAIAKLRILDLYNFMRQRGGKWDFCLMCPETMRLYGEWLSGDYRNLTGNTEMRKAIGAI